MQKGQKCTEETKQRMNNAQKKRFASHEHPFKGKCHSKESRQKISIANKGYIPWNKGKTMSLEYYRKNSEALKKYYETHDGPMKGKHHSEETLQKISIAKSGENCSLETRRKISDANKRRCHSKESKQKVSESMKKHYETHSSPMKGRTPWNKGKRHSDETRQKLSTAQKKRYETHEGTMKGKHLSKESRQKLSETHKGKRPSKETRQKKSESMKRIWLDPAFREKQLKSSFFDRYKQKPTKIELLMHAQLLHFGVYNFIPEFHIRGKDRSYFVDFLVFPNLIIECDGDYWHSKSRAIKRDQKLKQLADNYGYKLLRFTETEIRTDLHGIGDQITEAYQETRRDK